VLGVQGVSEILRQVFSVCSRVNVVCMCVVYYMAGVSEYSRVNVVCVCVVYYMAGVSEYSRVNVVCVCGILHSGCQCV
jgi:hypothetical protein